MAARQVVRRCQFPSPALAHQEREVLRVVVHLPVVHVERHTTEYLLQRLVAESQRVRRLEEYVIRIERARSARRQVPERAQRLHEVATVPVAVEPTRHEVFHAIQLVETAFAHRNPSRACLLVDFILLFACGRQALWRELDEPMLVIWRQIAVAGQEGIRLWVPADNRLRLCPARRRSHADDLAQRVGARIRRQSAIKRPPGLLHKLAHFDCGRPLRIWSPGWFVGQSPHPTRPHVGQTVKRRNNRLRNLLLVHPLVDQRIPK